MVISSMMLVVIVMAMVITVMLMSWTWWWVVLTFFGCFPFTRCLLLCTDRKNRDRIHWWDCGQQFCSSISHATPWGWSNHRQHEPYGHDAQVTITRIAIKIATQHHHCITPSSLPSSLTHHHFITITIITISNSYTSVNSTILHHTHQLPHHPHHQHDYGHHHQR